MGIRKRAIAIRHVPFEDLGTLTQAAVDAGYELTYVEAGMDDLTRLHLKPIDLLVVLGGPLGAYQDDEYPFLSDEIKLLETRFKAGLPTLGICLGSQLMARALGSRVFPNHQKEIGWAPLNLTDAGRQSYARHLGGDHTLMFHWHGDTFDLPVGATLHASTEICENQIYSFGKTALAIQCHPEVSQKGLEQWWIGHTGELFAHNLSPNSLRKETAKYAATLEAQASMFFKEWLQQIMID